MIALTVYFIKLLIVSGVLYAYYALALKNNPFHRWNRGYLLLATVASILLPLLQLSFITAPAPTYSAPLITVYGYMTNPAQQAGGFNTGAKIGTGIYSLIVLLMVINMIRNWLLIKRLARQGSRTAFTNYSLIRHPRVKSTFSFFGNIFWGEEIVPDSEEGRQVLRHELEHVNGGHTTDKLFLQLACAIFWFNPFFYLFKKELAMVHEFLADKAATAENAPDDYARTLLQMALQTKRMLIANSFTQAPVKRRIVMLFTHSANYAFMKKIIIFPVVVLMGLVIGCQQDMDLKMPEEAKSMIVSPFQSQTKTSSEVFTFVSDPPRYPGGDKALAQFLASKIRYPKLAQEASIEGTVFVSFVVSTDGTITDVKTVGKTLGLGLDEESIRVVKAMPKWEPGKHDGKLVNVAFNLPIRYVLQE
jgi:TonB family protein